MKNKQERLEKLDNCIGAGCTLALYSFLALVALILLPFLVLFCGLKRLKSKRETLKNSQDKRINNK